MRSQAVYFVIVILFCQFDNYIYGDMSRQHGANIEDNEFAEFEEFDDEPVEKPSVSTDSQQDKTAKHQQSQPKVIMSPEAAQAAAESQSDNDESSVEDEDEFDHFQDEEEFEGVETARSGKNKGQDKPPDLKITKIPSHLHTNWDSFYMEILMMAGLSVYLLNFLAGKSKNSRLAQTWLSAHREILESNFSIVGDDGTGTEVQRGVLMKDSENVYSLWCSGRLCCEGMLVTLKLLKRQDLVSSISRLLKPTSDQVIIKITMDGSSMESFVCCLGTKKILPKYHKEMNDLSSFCSERKSADRYNIHGSFQILSEIGEATSSIFDKTASTAINSYADMIEFIHISDQYSGAKPQEEGTPSKEPETSKVLIFSFILPKNGNCSASDIEKSLPLMKLVFYIFDKVRRMHLSKEAKEKASKNRQKVLEKYLKQNHIQRQEAAQLRREDKRREAKERIMNEEDPEKQRKLEERDNKREAKKKQPKVKMMKMKAA